MDTATNGGQQPPVTVKRALSSEPPVTVKRALSSEPQDAYTANNMDMHDQNSYDYHKASQTNMSLWARTSQLPEEYLRQVYLIYGPHFPIEVRHWFAQELESIQWQDIDAKNVQNTDYAQQILTEMIKMLKAKGSDSASADFMLKYKFQECAEYFEKNYSNCPLSFVDVVKNCLGQEQRLIHDAEQASVANSPSVQFPPAVHQQIEQQLTQIQQMTQITENDIKDLQQKQEYFILQIPASQELQAKLKHLKQQPQTAETKVMEEKWMRQIQHLIGKVTAQAQELKQMRLNLQEKWQQTFQQLTVVQTQVLDTELIEWKRKQALVGNGAQYDLKLDTLQKWCESLVQLVWANRQQIKKMEAMCTNLPIPTSQGPEMITTLNTTITSMLSSLVTSTFIVETQPPQVLKKESRFTATVRLLVGGQLTVHMNPPEVRASIISEMQARNLLRNDTAVKNENSGDMLNHRGTMEYQKGQLSITFRNMQLKRIKRADRKGEAVTEEKFCILFQSSFDVGGKELSFQVWTLSLPVVVTVHGNQECNALATVLWDNAFAVPDRVPFQVPDKVYWCQIADMLNTKFQDQTGAGLSSDNLNYLATKIFCTGKVTDDFSNHTVSWTKFNKEVLPSRNFTFWEWFHAIIKLTKEHLKTLWCDRAIVGFISKDRAQECLKTTPPGTFLLRFSDSESGGITIAWASIDQNNPGSECQVWNLAPFVAKDFGVRGLADRIKDLGNLINLYPNTPKDQAFGKYYTNTVEPMPDSQGYIPTLLVTKMTSQPSAPYSIDNPMTPQVAQPQSPSNYENPGSVGNIDISSPMANIDGMIAEDFLDLYKEPYEQLSQLLGETLGADNMQQ